MDIVARQASRRGGTLWLSAAGDRIRMSGQAALFSIAELQIGTDRNGTP